MGGESLWTVLCIDEEEVFEPLFLLFIPNPFSYISAAAPEEDIVQDWGTPNSHFSFPTEAEQQLLAVCNVGGKNGYSVTSELFGEKGRSWMPFPQSLQNVPYS